MLEVRDLTVCRNSRVVLSDVSLHVGEGETVVVYGPAGCGKSTLLRCIAGLDAADCGSVCVNGYAVLENGIPVPKRRMKAVRLRIGIVFQKLNLFPHLTAMENLTVPYRMVTGCGKVQAELECNRFLKEFDLRRIADLYPTAVSMEEQRRIAVARAMLFDPQLVLLDDLHTDQPETARELVNRVRQSASGPVTIVATTRQQEPARALMHRVLTISGDGKLKKAECSEGQ